MSEEDFALKPFIKATKDELGLGKIRIRFTETEHRAHCEFATQTIILPTIAAIQRLWDSDPEGSRVKQKAAVLEEECHLQAGREGHSPELFKCYRMLHDRHLTAREQELLQEKTEKLRRVCEGVLTPRKPKTIEPPSPSESPPMEVESSPASPP